MPWFCRLIAGGVFSISHSNWIEVSVMNRLLASILEPRRSGAVVRRYGAAIVSVALAAATAHLLRHYNLPHPFTSFSFAAIAVTFWYAGTGPGLLAVVLSCSTLSYFFTPVKFGNLPWDSYVIIYGVFGLFVCCFSSSRFRAERLLSEARDALEIRVAERTAELTTANQALQRAQEELSELTHQLAQENLYLEGEIRADANFKEIVGQSAELHRVLKLVETVAPTDSTVLIYGETGTGKELIARAIHNLSSRRSRAFIRLNCAAIPTGLLESELFGHEKGAFTSAVNQKIGRIELADKGTLFLDEIGELPIELQPKLLRVLQDREFERLGGVRTLHVDVRIISATNRDLHQDIANKKFREDLFYRLNVFPIDLPSLRQRRTDIPILVHHFVSKHSARMGKHIDTIPDETMTVLQNWNWPGNIRELENMVERMVILSKSRVLAAPPVELDAPQEITEDNLTEMEREHIIRVLRETHGMLAGTDGAATRLGIKRTTLQSMLKRLGIELQDFRRGSGTFGAS